MAEQKRKRGVRTPKNSKEIRKSAAQNVNKAVLAKKKPVDATISKAYMELREQIIQKGLRTQAAYIEYAKSNDKPLKPDQEFKGKGWVSWYSFFNL